MSSCKTHPEPPEQPQPLPLFRPEVQAAQQQRVFGEVLRLRTLSAGVLVWLGIVLAGLLFGILILVERPP